MAGLLALYFQVAHDGGRSLLAEVRGLLEAELGVAEDALEKVLLKKLPCSLRTTAHMYASTFSTMSL